MKMRGDKTAVYRNELGQELVMDNRTIFLESIDMTGGSGVHVSEGLAGADGQVTVDSRLSAKTIPCKIALYDRQRDDFLRSRVADILSPLLSGTLTVYTRSAKYSIDVRPQDSPTFTRESLRVWKFNVDFVADFPYWRLGEELPVPLTAANTVFFSDCVFDLPVRISFPANLSTQFGFQWSRTGAVNTWSQQKGFSVSSGNPAMIVDTKSCTVKTAEGVSCNQYIDASAPLNVMKIRHGYNKIYCLSGYDSVTVTYYRLSQGEA